MDYLLENWISILSLFIALTALFFTYKRSSIAEKTLELTKKQAEQRKPVLAPYLIKSFIYLLPDKNSRIYAFLVSISNPTDINNSTSRVELKISYKIKESDSFNVILSHNATLQSHFGFIDNAFSNSNALVNSHTTVTGWILFELNEINLKDASIESYKILFTDTHGIISDLEPIIISELLNKDDMANI